MTTFSHAVFTDAISGPTLVVSYAVHPVHLYLSHSFSDWSVVDTRKFTLRYFLFLSAQISVMVMVFDCRPYSRVQAKNFQLLSVSQAVKFHLLVAINFLLFFLVVLYSDLFRRAENSEQRLQVIMLFDERFLCQIERFYVLT